MQVASNNYTNTHTQHTIRMYNLPIFLAERPHQYHAPEEDAKTHVETLSGKAEQRSQHPEND